MTSCKIPNALTLELVQMHFNFQSMYDQAMFPLFTCAFWKTYHEYCMGG